MLASTAAPTSVIAQEESPGVAEARRYFDQGSAHFEAGRFALAVDAFRQAYDRLIEIEHPRASLLLFNMGRSYEALGRDAEAHDAYARFLASPPDSPELVAQVNQQMAELDARLAVSEVPRGESVSPLGPIVLGVGGAAVVTGLILAAVGLAQDGGVGEICPSRENCSESLRGQYEEAQRLVLAGDILWVGGAVLAATGLALTLLLREGESSRTANVWCAPGGCGLSLEGSF